MKKIKVGINGLGRIGRAFIKLAAGREELEIVAVNDLGDIHNFAYLLNYDTAYGRSDLGVVAKEGKLVIGGQEIQFLSEKNPAMLPWGKLGVEVVVESTGIFDSYSGAKAHLEAGARRVVISAPVKDEEVPGIKTGTVLLGINEEKMAELQITSNGSCTTNCVAPIIKIMAESVGVKKAMLNTTHAYTATQKIVDGPDAKDFRRGRAAAQNLAPSSTGAATAVAQVIPAIKGLFDGLAVRVPVVAGSLSDITFVSGRNTTKEEINNILTKAAGGEEWKNIFTVTSEPLVSSDILNYPYASIVDLPMTRVVGGDLVKIMAWYDNEMGYTHTLVDHVIKAGNFI